MFSNGLLSTARKPKKCTDLGFSPRMLVRYADLLVVDAASAEMLLDRNFWPRPLNALMWNFERYGPTNTPFGLAASIVKRRTKERAQVPPTI